MRFSLILTTVGRTYQLERFLASLQKQSYRNFELIVVDQNPDDRLMPLLATYNGLLPISRLPSSRRGASRGRNLGLNHSTGDLLAFPDDDCQYPPDLLAKVARAFVERPDADGFTGRSVDELGNSSNGRFDARSGPINESNVWARAIEYTIFLRKQSVGDVRFDENIGPGVGTPWGAGEGTDFLLSLLRQGCSLLYDPTTLVVHPSPVPPFDQRAFRRAYSYGVGMGYVMRKHERPFRCKANRLIRPLGGVVLSSVRLRPREAWFRWNTFKGRLRGLLS